MTRVSHVCRCLRGAGEANFLGGVAKLKGVADFDVAKAKQRFFDIYINEVSRWDSDSLHGGGIESDSVADSAYIVFVWYFLGFFLCVLK